MPDKRKLKRRHLIYYLRVFSGNAKNPLGFIVDINSDGVMLLSEKELKTGKTLKLKMDLPETFGNKSKVSFEAKCRWCKQGLNSDFYESGFEFAKISKEDADMIENVVSYFGFND